MVYVARYLSIAQRNKYQFWRSLVELWLPVMLIIATILQPNLSTAALIGILVFTGIYWWLSKNIYC